MVTQDTITGQLSALGLRFRFFGRHAANELVNIIKDDETIRHCVYGSYQGGRALLVATDHRILLIDKRPFFLNLEDLRYEMLNEVYFAGRLLNAQVKLHSGSRVLDFTSIADARLRKLYTYTQDQITRARQLEHMHDVAKPARSEWSPYTMLGQSRVRRFTGHIAMRKLLQY